MENIQAEKSQIWKFVLEEQQSIIDPILEMKMNLEQKYLFHFNFFLSKPINQIVYELTSRPTTQAFLDSRIAAQQAQYLKRQYRCKTEQGVEQINDRIKMLGGYFFIKKEFYSMSENRWKFQYPMMIITDTKSIFQKRQRRYRKICAGEGSSDETQQKQSYFCYSFDTEHFLKDMSNLSKMYNEQKNEQNQQSFDSDVHDVYLNQKSIYTRLNFSQPQLDQNESSVNIFKVQSNTDHLICDFEDSNIEVFEEKKNDQKELQVLNYFSNKEHRKPLKSYDNKNISLPKSHDENSKGSDKSKKPNFLNSYLNLFENKYRKIYLQNHSTMGTTQIKTSQNDTTKNYGIKQIDTMIDKQKEEKLKSRKKIRQKAEQLLRRVRISSQAE